MPRYIFDFSALCAMTIEAKSPAEAREKLFERFPDCSTVGVVDSAGCLIPDTLMEATFDEEAGFACTRDDSEDDPEDVTLPGDDA